MQTNPVNYMDFLPAGGTSVHFDGLAPNIQVKIPATATGIVAIEEATRRGVNINATVSFTLPQAIAVAERWSAASIAAPRKVTTSPACGPSAR